MNRAVFLDRDNTIIHNDEDLGDPEQVRLIQGAASAIASLRGLGYKVVVVTNQGGVARGSFTEDAVEAVHQRIAELIGRCSGARIDRFYYCPCHPEGSVEPYAREDARRKPQPGMLLQAAEELELDLSACWMVGDHIRDVQAGKAAGCRTLLLCDHARNPLDELEGDERPDLVARRLIEAVRMIGQQRRPAPGETSPLRPASVSRPAPPPSQEDTNRSSEPADHREPASQPAPSQEKTALQQNASSAAPPTRAPARAQQNDRAKASDQAAQHAAAHGRDARATKHVAPKRSSADPDAQSSHVKSEQDTQLLTHILHELKSQRAEIGDFSYHKLLGVIVQMVVLGCLFFGLMHVSETVVFFQWLAGAVVGQLMVVSLLILHERK